MLARTEKTSLPHFFLKGLKMAKRAWIDNNGKVHSTKTAAIKADRSIKLLSDNIDLFNLALRHGGLRKIREYCSKEFAESLIGDLIVSFCNHTNKFLEVVKPSLSKETLEILGDSLEQIAVKNWINTKEEEIQNILEKNQCEYKEFTVRFHFGDDSLGVFRFYQKNQDGGIAGAARDIIRAFNSTNGPIEAYELKRLTRSACCPMGAKKTSVEQQVGYANKYGDIIYRGGKYSVAA